MHVLPTPTLVCPHDGAPLVRRANNSVCANGHSFDWAREGYVNLLPVGDKASRDPGDSKAMVAARRRFLETGAYAPIAAALAGVIRDCIAARETKATTILDAGCGEGYYLEHLAGALAAGPSNTTVHLAGIDISKWAVRAAAKRRVAATWVVASNRRPPLQTGSVDLIVCLFGFASWPGFAAIQPPGGEVLMIDPGPDHLLELRQIIYPEVRRVDREPLSVTPGYQLLAEPRRFVCSTAHVTGAAAIADLLAMTPHGHRATAPGRAALSALTSLDVTLDVTLRHFQCAPDAADSV